MQFWNELELVVKRPSGDEPAVCYLKVNLATEGTEQRVTRATRTFLVESPEAQDIDAIQAWTVAMLGQIYASVHTSIQMGHPGIYPVTSSRT